MTAPARPPVVLVGYDDSRAGQSALRKATDLARRLGAQLQVVHAVVPALPLTTAPAGLPGHAYVPAPEDVEEQRARAREEMFEQVRSQLGDAPVDWSFDAVSGDAVHVLEEQAHAVEAYLVVVGTRHAGIGTALDRLLHGSTSRALQRRCDRPVLVVPEDCED
jgi:nucleotide-binding universal stress UspA family protein